jgi:hypothetical protein
MAIDSFRELSSYDRNTSGQKVPILRRCSYIASAHVAKRRISALYSALFCLLLLAPGGVQVGMWGDWGDTRANKQCPMRHAGGGGGLAPGDGE